MPEVLPKARRTSQSATSYPSKPSCTLLPHLPFKTLQTNPLGTEPKICNESNLQLFGIAFIFHPQQKTPFQSIQPQGSSSDEVTIDPAFAHFSFI